MPASQGEMLKVKRRRDAPPAPPLRRRPAQTRESDGLHAPVTHEANGVPTAPGALAELSRAPEAPPAPPQDVASVSEDMAVPVHSNTEAPERRDPR